MLTLIIILTVVDGPWLRQKLGISVSTKTGPAAKLLSLLAQCRYSSCSCVHVNAPATLYSVSVQHTWALARHLLTSVVTYWLPTRYLTYILTYFTL